MNAVDYILDGLEKELELERELVVRSVEIDRSLLIVPKPAQRQPATKPSAAPSQPPVAPPRSSVAPSRTSVPPPDFVFLHDRALSPKGVEMMARIVNWMAGVMKVAPESIKIVTEPPRPPASLYVVLGARALERFLPGMKGAPGHWLRSEDGKDVLVTYSPEYFQRFRVLPAAIKLQKKEMQGHLENAMQRIARMKS